MKKSFVGVISVASKVILAACLCLYASLAHADPYRFICQLIEDANGKKLEECVVKGHPHPHTYQRSSYSIMFYPDGVPPSAIEVPSVGIDYDNAYNFPVAATVQTFRSKYTPDELDNVCDFNGGTGNGVVARYHKWIHCLPDDDGDGIANFYDDCPFNSDNSYCSDLPDCDVVVRDVFSALAGAGTIAGVAYGAGITAEVVIGGVAVSATAIGAGVAAGTAMVGFSYCIISELEN